MGIFDRIQAAADDFNARQQATQSQTLAASFPPGTPIPRLDTIRPSPHFGGATVQAYFAAVGMPPEDVYAVLPVQSNDVNIAYEVIYRDRPEYEAGRAAWAAGGN